MTVRPPSKHICKQADTANKEDFFVNGRFGPAKKWVGYKTLCVLCGALSAYPAGRFARTLPKIWPLQQPFHLLNFLFQSESVECEFRICESFLFAIIPSISLSVGRQRHARSKVQSWYEMERRDMGQQLCCDLEALGCASF